MKTPKLVREFEDRDDQKSNYEKQIQAYEKKADPRWRANRAHERWLLKLDLRAIAKQATLILALLTPCIPATLRSESPEPVLPIGSDRISSGTVYGPFYSVVDKDGREHTGVTVGSGGYSITVPSNPDEKPIMRSGANILPLD